MRTLQKSVLVAVVAVATVGGPAIAGSGSASLAGVQVDYTITDAYFDGPGCAEATWTLRYTQPADTDLDVTMTLGRPGDPDPLQDSVLVDTLGPVTASESGTFCVKHAGMPLQFGGSLVVRDIAFEDLGEVPLSTSTVAVVPNPTRFTRAVARRAAVRGEVVGETRTMGALAADGRVNILTKRKGAWSQVGTATLNDAGMFKAPLTRTLKKGKKVRVQIAGCGWCTDATVKATVR